MLQKVNTQHLEIGMYVSTLDRPWVDTPFMFQGFVIKDQEDISELQRHCAYVNIDPAQGKAADYSIVQPLSPPDSLPIEKIAGTDPSAAPVQSTGTPPETTSLFNIEYANPTATPTFIQSLPAGPVYEDTLQVTEELEFAREAHAVATEAIHNVMDDARAGRKLNGEGIREAVGGMVESILRNPDAFLWLNRLKDIDSYSYSHCISAATLGIAFGRHMGLPAEELACFGTGALLFDVGKTRLPEELLNKQERLTAAEFKEIQKHVGYSVEIMSATKGIPQDAINIALSHHERHNGSGYPRGLIGDAIPVYGRMAAVVDCYDAITSARTYAEAISPHEAVRRLYEWRNIDFQEEVVEQFIQCLGVYPIGTLVELSSGQVGIILSQNRVRRLRPRLMLILDAEKQAYDISPIVDLLAETTDANGKPLEIAKALDTGAYGIDPQEFYI